MKGKQGQCSDTGREAYDNTWLVGERGQPRSRAAIRQQFIWSMKFSIGIRG